MAENDAGVIMAENNQQEFRWKCLKWKYYLSGEEIICVDCFNNDRSSLCVGSYTLYNMHQTGENEDVVIETLQCQICEVRIIIATYEKQNFLNTSAVMQYLSEKSTMEIVAAASSFIVFR